MKVTNKPLNIALVIITITVLFFIISKLLNNNVHNVSEQILPKENLKVLLYIKNGCSYCNMAKELLTENRITYETVDLSFDLNLQKKLVAKTGQVTVPYVFINNKFIGGYSNLLTLKKENKL